MDLQWNLLVINKILIHLKLLGFMKPQAKLNAVRPFYGFIDAQIYFQLRFSSCCADGSVNHLYTNCSTAARFTQCLLSAIRSLHLVSKCHKLNGEQKDTLRVSAGLPS